MINKTNINHGLLSLVIQLALAPVAWLAVQDVQAALVLSGTAAVAAFAGREYGQVERKAMNRMNTILTNKHGEGNFEPMTLTKMMPWHVFKPNLWTLDHYMDILVPAVVNSAVVVCAPAVITAVTALLHGGV